MKRKKVRRARKRTPIRPRTANQLSAMPERFQDAYQRMLVALNRLRQDHESLQQAAREAGSDPRTVKKLAGPALRKAKNGRYSATHGDQLLRVIKIPTPEGLREVGIRGSRRASAVGEYSAAVERFIVTGDRTRLSKFTGKGIPSDSGEIIPFITDTAVLKPLGNAGQISFESLYARSA